MIPSSDNRHEYVTIFAPSAGEAMAQFKAQGLDREGYAIAGPIGRHRTALVDTEGASAIGPEGIAATFRRTVPA